MQTSFFPPRPQSSQNGAILVLTIAVLSVFMLLAYFAIDLTSLMAQHMQQQHNARFVALAAIEEYFDVECDEDTAPACHSIRINAALERARSVASANITLKAKFVDPEKIVLSPIGDDDYALLETGRWYVEQEPGDPCGSSYPCFEPTSVDVNAIRLSGKLYESRTSIISDSILDAVSFPLGVEVVAHVIPRHGCFLVDLSPSVTRTTHMYGNRTINDAGNNILVKASEYAFYLAQDNDPSSTSAYDNTWFHLDATRPPNNTLAIAHFKDEFEVKTTLVDGNYAGANPDGIAYANHHPPATSYPMNDIVGNYRLDYHRDLVSGYEGPEPLLSIFRGLYKAVELFEERAVAGDRICLIFFDSRLAWPRIVNLTNDFEYVKKLIDPKQITNPSANEEHVGGNLAPRMVHHGLFPAREAHTNVMLAVSEALRQFKEVGNVGAEASNFLVYIGDGLADCNENACPADPSGDGNTNHEDFEMLRNCLEELSGQPISLPAPTTQEGVNEWLNLTFTILDSYNPYEDISEIAPSCGAFEPMDQGQNGNCPACISYFIESMVEQFGCRICQFDAVHYKAALYFLKLFARTTLFQAKIPFHVILAGDHSAPHTLDIYDANLGRCLTDVEARNRELDFVLGGDETGSYPPGFSEQSYLPIQQEGVWWNLMLSGTMPYYQVNLDWYRIAQATGGIWGPIRPVNSLCTPGGGPLGDTCNHGQRRLTDTDCRTTKEQIQDHMEAIMKQNPYGIAK